jgi:hypothetical protein
LNPCFNDIRVWVSADVLLEGIREHAERRGLLRTAPDVTTFVITSLFCGSCLEAIKLTVPHRTFQGSHKPATSGNYERNKPEEGSAHAEGR